VDKPILDKYVLENGSQGQETTMELEEIES
jgi:hypothetical protein